MPKNAYKKPDQLRQSLDCRVHPKTLAAINATATARGTSIGRAVDCLVKLAQSDKDEKDS